MRAAVRTGFFRGSGAAARCPAISRQNVKHDTIMEFLEILRKRRSVRKFTDRPVPGELIDRLLEAALTAPSARNTRSTLLLPVTDRALIDRMAQMRDMPIDRKSVV